MGSCCCRMLADFFHLKIFDFYAVFSCGLKPSKNAIRLPKRKLPLIYGGIILIALYFIQSFTPNHSLGVVPNQ